MPSDHQNQSEAATRSPSSGPAGGAAGRSGQGLPKLVLPHPSGAVVEVFLQGAHVASWLRPDGDEMLFMSRESRLEPGVPIRGGIPLVFPQFASRGPLPQHGFARTLPWDVVGSGLDAHGAAFARFRLTDFAETLDLWPHPFVAELLVTLDDGLTTTLKVTNTGSDPFSFTSALHTYLRLDDVRTVTVEGLQGSRYLGVLPDGEPVSVHEALRIDRETNGVYTDVGDRLRVLDPDRSRTIVIEKEGFVDAVVWNPWIERSRAMDDFADDEYPSMLCVEPANIVVPTRLEPGGSWSGTQRITIA